MMERYCVDLMLLPYDAIRAAAGGGTKHSKAGGQYRKFQ